MKKLWKSILATSVTIAACGQSTFQNLDFEDAVVQPIDPRGIFLNWSLAAPGWSHSVGNDTSVVFYQQGHLGVSQIFLLMDATSPEWAPGTQLEDNYSLAFASGFLNGYLTDPWVNAYISQAGDVPGSARSIRLLATGPLQVYLGGVEVQMFPLGGNAYVGDASAFAGNYAELKIVNTASDGDFHHYSVVDNILFSPEAIPEPSALGLFGLSGVLLAVQRHYRRRLTP